MNSLNLYNALREYFGEVGVWWPKENPFEVVVGAILAQQTKWSNVEKVLNDLKKADALTPKGIAMLPSEELKSIVKPSGFFNQKSERLKEISEYILAIYDGNVKLLFDKDKKLLREELLVFKGVGKETADSIILYGAEKKEFVVDTYTKRIYSRLNIVDEKISYDNLKKHITSEIPEELIVYQEFHGLIVLMGKNLCKKYNPKCGQCPLNSKCNFVIDKKNYIRSY